MCDGVSRSDRLQRAAGELRLSVKLRDGDAVLDGLRQAGCLKARFPRPLLAGWFDATLINSSGGVAGGDQLRTRIEVAAGACATIAAQAAERFYRALPGGAPAAVENAVTIAADAVLEWLPQETILFDRCALDRRLTVDVASGGRFLGVEMLVFGRAAMGERVASAALRDLIQVRCDGALLWHDAIRLDGAVDALLARPAIAAGAAALATVVYVAPDAEARLQPLRAALADAPVECGASAWNGMAIARILARTGALSRLGVMAALSVLRDGRPMPRAWLC